MAEPTSIFGILALHSLYHVIGSGVTHTLSTASKLVYNGTKKIIQEKSVPENNELLACLRLSMIKASEIMIYKGIGVMESVGKNEEAKELKTFARNWFEEEGNKKRALQIVQTGTFETEAYNQIEQLLAFHKGEDSRVLISDLELIVRKGWKREMESGIGMNLPDIVSELFENGWNDEHGIHQNWFDVTKNWFAKLLQDKEWDSAKIIFQNRLLADIVVDIKVANKKIDIIDHKVDTIDNKVDTLMAWISSGKHIFKPDEMILLEKTNELRLPTRFADYDKLMSEIQDLTEELRQLLPNQINLITRKKEQLSLAQNKLIDFTKKIISTYEIITHLPINTSRAIAAKQLFEAGMLDEAIAVLSTADLDAELIIVKETKQHLQKKLEMETEKAKIV